MIAAGYKKGFTLVELTTALAISAMLTAAALGVVVQMSRQAGGLEAQDKAVDLPQRIRHILTADIANATAYRAQESGFELIGHAALDEKTLAVTHLPSRVAYVIEKVSGQDYLFRRQRRPDGRELDELVCQGISKISIGPLDGELAEESERFSPLPAAVAVRLELQDRPEPIELAFRRR